MLAFNEVNSSMTSHDIIENIRISSTEINEALTKSIGGTHIYRILLQKSKLSKNVIWFQVFRFSDIKV